jgi:hypothetical protein
MTSNNQQDGYVRTVYEYGDLPETPPAHIWAFKALRNQILGTRPSPLVTTNTFEEESEEVRIYISSIDIQLSVTPEGTPSCPSNGGILKTPGTISRRKSVTFDHKKSPPPSMDNDANKTPIAKRTSILSRNFPGKYPSPYTPRTRQSTPQQTFTANEDGDTDLIPVSRTAIETLAAHVELLLENNNRLQQIISSGELMNKSYSPYSGHPDLEAMKRELEREKGVLSGLFGDFELQQASIAQRERELNAQYNALSQQMEEQYALQSSTAKIVDDYQQTIQQLNKAIGEERESYQRDLAQEQARADGYEDKVHKLQAELDEAKDLLRGNRQELEAKDYLIAETQEKLRKTQRQLSQLRMETLESRVGPHSGVLKDGTGGEIGHRLAHRRTTSTSRRSVSATYNTTTASEFAKPSEILHEEHQPEPLIQFKTGTIFRSHANIRRR